MKLFQIILIISVILVTIIVGTANPKLHKTFIITGSDFKLERYSDDTKSKIVLAPQTENIKQRPVKIEPSAFLTETKEIKAEDIQPAEIETPVAEEPEPQIEDNTQEKKKLSWREEQIAWNKWRSDLTNEIMMSAQVEATMGTLFFFSFKVDKFRHISNIKAYSTNPLFMDEAKTKIIPAIKKLEYSALLTFPKGSKRKDTKVNASFLIWDETNLASPSDFNDIERVNVYE